MTTLYQKDFYSWCVEQAQYLRDCNLDKLDFKNLQQELLEMGGSEKRELESRLTVLFQHLLKWLFQKDMRTKGWKNTIRIQRIDVQRHLNTNPGLKPYLLEILDWVYEKAIDKAAKETGLDCDKFPQKIPFTIDQALDNNWLPESGFNL